MSQIMIVISYCQSDAPVNYSDYFFQLICRMRSIGFSLVPVILLALSLQGAIISLASSGTRIPIKMATITSIDSLQSPQAKLKALGVPGYSFEHSYNILSLDGWTCQGEVQKSPLSYWTTSSIWASHTQQELKNRYNQNNISLLLNLFGPHQLPISANQTASGCAQNLKKFLQKHLFDGVNLDFRDKDAITSGLALPWLTQFLLAMGKEHSVSITVGTDLLDLQLGPDLAALQKALGARIPFWVIRHSTTSYSSLYDGGKASVNQLIKRGLPVGKIVLEAPSQPWQEGFSNGFKLLSWARKALNAIGWSAGFSVRPFTPNEAEDYLQPLISGRNSLVPVASTNLDGVNFWWPPEKTVGDLGVPSFSPNQDYNHFVFGTWTCQNGAFDIAKLWSQANYYLSNKFGETTLQIQSFLKERYLSQNKQIVVKAFGRAESPTSAKLQPKTCARKLASFVLINQLDGVQVHYQDNDAFNAGIAEQWLVTFTRTLKELLPFHVLSHAIQDRYLNPLKFKGGSYSSVIKQVGTLLNFYPVVYYGEQHTQFNTYSELFTNSGEEFPESSLSQLVSRGFQLNKIVIGKPVALYDAQGAGFVEAAGLRPLFLKAYQELGWKGGISYSTFLKDQDGNVLKQLLRGKPNGPIYMSYLNNLKTWWPPKTSLAEMGAPTLAPPNKYNHLALAFWTCEAPKAMAKLYDDPITYFGQELGKDKKTTQQYIHSLYAKGGVTLMVSTFGDTQFPASAGFDPIDCANKLVEYVLLNGLDGVDIDFQDSESFRDGTGEPWLATFTQELRKKLPFHTISHAPQGPYFSPSFSEKGAYRGLKTVFSDLVDFYNVQYYNQGNTTYETYSELFLDSGYLNPDSAVYQLIHQGIRPQQVVLGKPVTKEDAYNTGWVSSQQLNHFLMEAGADSRNPGWTPNLMFWHYLSDLNGTFLAAAIKDL